MKKIFSCLLLLCSALAVYASEGDKIGAAVMHSFIMIGLMGLVGTIVLVAVIRFMIKAFSKKTASQSKLDYNKEQLLDDEAV